MLSNDLFLFPNLKGAICFIFLTPAQKNIVTTLVQLHSARWQHLTISLPAPSIQELLNYKGNYVLNIQCTKQLI